jgi:hypothetical protein
LAPIPAFLSRGGEKSEKTQDQKLAILGGDTLAPAFLLKSLRLIKLVTTKLLFSPVKNVSQVTLA